MRVNQIENNPLIKKLFEDIKADEKFYFLHKYYCEQHDPSVIKIYSKVNHLLMHSMFVKKNDQSDS